MYSNASGPRPTSNGFSRRPSSFSSQPRGGYSRGGFSNNRRSGGYSNRRPKGLDVSQFINTNVIELKEEKFIPVHKFTDFALEPIVKSNIVGKNYLEPTPIQDQAIPAILEGHNVLGLANTGTGKTAAFIIPLINKILKNRDQKVLIVCPTRELALQINDEMQTFARGTGIYSIMCIGGTSMRSQIHYLTKPFNFIIGTPGRLKDLIYRKSLHLDRAAYLVLDEVDRMLDMGFIEDIQYIVDKMPEEKQTLFFSATISNEVKGLINEFLKVHKAISVKKQDFSNHIAQDIIKVKGPMEKIEKLCELLKQDEFKKVLVFGKTKHGVDKLDQELYRRGFKVVSIHGDKTQSGRQRALESFKKNYAQVMIATDIAARGLDIPEVTHVINYELPSTYEDYIHRIGRTGRASKFGKALTFVEESVGHRFGGRY